MVAIAAVLVVVLLAILVTRIASSALEMTGVSRELARFQARSAYTGVGFTTTEAESVVDQPVRRRIILALMLLGNAGVAGVIASLVIGFVQTDSLQVAAIRFGVLVGGLGLLWWLSRVDAVERWLRRMITRALDHWTDLRIRDYVQLLGMERGYEIRELEVQEDDWLANRRLETLDLNREGVLLLALRREDGRYFGAPHPETEILPGDTLLVYGRMSNLTELDDRGSGVSGDQAHQEAVSAQKRVQAEEASQDQ